MARRASSLPQHQVLLDRLERSFADTCGSDIVARRAAPSELRMEAVSAVRAGITPAAVARAAGVSVWTISQWLKSLPTPSTSVRELTLVTAGARSAAPMVSAVAQVATLRLPGGIQLDVPVSA